MSREASTRERESPGDILYDLLSKITRARKLESEAQEKHVAAEKLRSEAIALHSRLGPSLHINTWTYVLFPGNNETVIKVCKNFFEVIDTVVPHKLEWPDSGAEDEPPCPEPTCEPSRLAADCSRTTGAPNGAL